jgi:hypothetical protein
MKHEDIQVLLDSGAYDRLRKKLKRLSIGPRFKVLRECIPLVKTSPQTINFFQKNFSVEIGAILMASEDLEKAESIYRAAR